jgi:hypothetical protein
MALDYKALNGIYLRTECKRLIQIVYLSDLGTYWVNYTKPPFYGDHVDVSVVINYLEKGLYVKATEAMKVLYGP